MDAKKNANTPRPPPHPRSPPVFNEQVQKSQYYFFQAVEFLLPGKFLFVFSARSTK